MRDRLARIASQRLNVPADLLEFAGGTIRARDNPDNAVPFYRVAGLAHWSPGSLPEGMEQAVRETASWSAPELTPTTENDEINSQLAYGFGVDYCGVEVDRDTCAVRVDRYVSAHDCGPLLNPGLAHGQIGGSFAAAVGAALYEEFVYAEDGGFLSGTFADYLVPTAPEMPPLEIVHGPPSPSPFTLLGAKGIAEGNTFTTPVCIANAVADALGLDDVVLPLTPSRLAGRVLGPEKPPAAGREVPGSDTPSAGTAITGRLESLVAAPPEALWDLLLDPAALADVVPGCETLDAAGPHRYRAVARIGAGPVRGRFRVEVRLADLDPPRRMTLAGEAAGDLGAGRGEGVLTLAPEGDGTRIVYAYEVHLSGKIAAVGGRMLRGATRAVVADLFRRLARRATGAESRAAAWWRRLLPGAGLSRRDR